MALSPEEQALLDEMEAELAASDPKLVSTLRGTPALIVNRRRALLGLGGFVVGVGILVAGMVTHPLVSVLGFLVMLASTLVALRAWQHVDGRPDGEEDVAPVPTPERGTVSDRLEAWRRHLDAGND